MSNEEFELVNFICEKCGKVLVKTFPTGRVVCKNCNYGAKQRPRVNKISGTVVQKYSMSVVCK